MALSASDLVGTWRLETCEVIDDEAGLQRPFGSSPRGSLVYTTAGVMLFAMMRSDRTRLEASDLFRATAAEKAAVVDGFLSYGGSYEVVGNRVIHHIDVSLFPNWVGTTQERIVHLEGNSLILEADRGMLGGSRVARLQWSRVGPPG